MIEMAARFILFFLSFLGYILWMKEKFKLKPEFSPVIICCFIGTVMFLAGILNILSLTAWAFFLFGLFQLRHLVNWKQYIQDKRLLIILSVFGIVCLLFAFRMKGLLFTHYDNFSHWALVARDILRTDHLPNFNSELIMFQAYPTGSAVFIYYVCKFIGDSEGCMAFAQTLIILSSIFAFTVFINKKNAWLSPLVFGASLYFFTANIQITELLVDTILPLLGLSGVIISYYYRHDIKKGILFTSPILCFLICLKNSGIYFTVILFVFILYLAIKNHSIKQAWKHYTFFSVISPFALLYLWKQHVSYSFLEGDLSKHAMSLNNYLNIFKEKSPQDILDIIHEFIVQTFSLNNEAMLIFIVGIIIFGISWFIFTWKRKKAASQNAWKILLFFSGIYIIYLITLLAMYIFSMPLGESKYLADYFRYSQTIGLFLYGVVLIYILSHFPVLNLKNPLNLLGGIAACLIFAAPLFNHYDNITQLFIKENITNTSRYELEMIKKQYEIEEGKRYFVYIASDQGSTGYYYFMMRYVMNSNAVGVYNDSTLVDADIDLNNYDYLICFAQDNIIDALIDQSGVESSAKLIVV